MGYSAPARQIKSTDPFRAINPHRVDDQNPNLLTDLGCWTRSLGVLNGLFVLNPPREA